jgi:hypothetical protein
MDAPGMALQGIILANDTTRSAPEKKLGPIPDVLMSIGAVFMAVLGIAAQFGVMAAYRRGDMHIAGAILLFAFGVMLAGVGLWGLYERFVTTPRRHARLARIEALHPGAPWMLNEAWAERKVVDRSGATVAIFLWIWSAGWWGACALIWSVNRNKIIEAVSSSWGDAFVCFVLVSCGLIGLWCAIAMTIKWWRNGLSTLSIDTLPGYLGNRFRGTVTARVPASMPLEAEVVCERVTVLWVRTPKNGRRKELAAQTVWSHEWALESDRMTRTREGEVIIPIDVALPDDKPSFDLDDEGGGIQWKLHVRTDYVKAQAALPNRDKSSGIDRYGSEFLIPVYART